MLNRLAEGIVTHQETVRFDIFNVAIIYACAGNGDRAVEMLYKAYEMRNPNTPFLVNPVFDLVKDDPRYIDLRKKMNLPA